MFGWAKLDQGPLPKVVTDSPEGTLPVSGGSVLPNSECTCNFIHVIRVSFSPSINDQYYSLQLMWASLLQGKRAITCTREIRVSYLQSCLSVVLPSESTALLLEILLPGLSLQEYCGQETTSSNILVINILLFTSDLKGVYFIFTIDLIMHYVCQESLQKRYSSDKNRLKELDLNMFFLVADL